MTLHEAHAEGFNAALARFGVKQAGLLPMWHPQAGLGTQVLRSLIGHPDVIMKEGLKPFRSGGPLSLGRMFWPGKDVHAVPRWLGRASTMLSALPLIDAFRGGGDPNEGRGSNMLGHIGGTLGSIYGGQALGMVGAPLVGALGAGVGKTLGRAFGSRPAPQPQQQPDPQYPQYYQQGGY